MLVQHDQDCDCAVCRQWRATSAALFARVARSAAPPAARPRRQRRDVPCVHEGQVIERCPWGNEDRHVRDCDLYDRCTRGTSRIQSCAACPDYQATPPPPAAEGVGGVRHLLYHCLPVRGNGRWQRNLEQLREHIGLFNGRKVVAVLADTGVLYRPKPGRVNPDAARVPLVLDPPEAVEAALVGCGVEFVRVENDPNLREVASFDALFGRLAQSYRRGDVALWAHAKGTTRRPGHPAKRWADVLYEAMLGHWPAVLDVLKRYPVAGCFKKLGAGWSAAQSRSDWHYSGSWFWFNCHELFRRDWRRIDQFWSGIEPYPSQQFDSAEAGVVFFQGRVPAVDLYSMRYWDRTVHPAWERWKQQNSHNRTDISSFATSSPTA